MHCYNLHLTVLANSLLKFSRTPNDVSIDERFKLAQPSFGSSNFYPEKKPVCQQDSCAFIMSDPSNYDLFYVISCKCPGF